jgi:hypothetical protein
VSEFGGKAAPKYSRLLLALFSQEFLVDGTTSRILSYEGNSPGKILQPLHDDIAISKQIFWDAERSID